MNVDICTYGVEQAESRCWVEITRDLYARYLCSYLGSYRGLSPTSPEFHKTFQVRTVLKLGHDVFLLYRPSLLLAIQN